MEEVLCPGAFIAADSFCALPDTYGFKFIGEKVTSIASV